VDPTGTPRPAAARYPLFMRPTVFEIAAAGLLVIVLTALVVVLVVATVPEGGPPTLR
jgi:hypothetical protein